MGARPKSPDHLPILEFPDGRSWDRWLAENHATSRGFWMKIAKKGSGRTSVNYRESVEVALCHGWIDGQKMKYDGSFWLQRFTPRRRNSVWSQINKNKVKAFIKQGMMRPAGLRAVDEAKRNGRWQAAYGPSRSIRVPRELSEALSKNPVAKASFAKLKRGQRYAILFWLQTAKRPETRLRRIRKAIIKLQENPEDSIKRLWSSS